MNSSSVGLFKKMVKVLVRSIARSRLLIVTDIISGIMERGVETGIDPQCIAPEALYIVSAD
jgi:hypothetical protein